MMTKNRYSVLWITISSFMVSSCDPGSNIKYVIINNTQKPIKVKYQFSSGPPVMFDTIAKGSNKMIYSENRLGYADMINDRMDSLYLYTFVISQGHKKSTLNFKNKKYWIFKKNNDLDATYLLPVDESTFKEK